MNLLKNWYLVYIYSFFILVGQVLPTTRVTWENVPDDKIIHFIIYFLLVLIVIKTSIENKKLHPYLYALGYAFGLGLVAELVQYPLPYRNFEVIDIVFNTLGSLIGILCYKVFSLAKPFQR
jgi:VanZ family protein